MALPDEDPFTAAEDPGEKPKAKELKKRKAEAPAITEDTNADGVSMPAWECILPGQRSCQLTVAVVKEALPPMSKPLNNVSAASSIQYAYVSITVKI